MNNKYFCVKYWSHSICGQYKAWSLTNQDAARMTISNGKKLRAAGPTYNKVYVDRDWPPDVASSLADLRKQAYLWTKDHVGDTAFVRSGKLIINGITKASVNLK